MKHKEIELHCFICTNKREGRKASCSTKGATELRTELKNYFKNKYPNKVKITASGCLGYCQKGVAGVIYPDKKWYFDLDKNSFLDIKNQVESLLELNDES